jgi:transcriptional regulator with XRE-family HTH domain
MNNLNKNILALRNKYHLSQKEFGESVGVQRSAIASYETLGRTPKINTLILIADTYNITLDELIRGDIKEE